MFWLISYIVTGLFIAMIGCYALNNDLSDNFEACEEYQQMILYRKLSLFVKTIVLWLPTLLYIYAKKLFCPQEN